MHRPHPDQSLTVSLTAVRLVWDVSRCHYPSYLRRKTCELWVITVMWLNSHYTDYQRRPFMEISRHFRHLRIRLHYSDHEWSTVRTDFPLFRLSLPTAGDMKQQLKIWRLTELLPFNDW